MVFTIDYVDGAVLEWSVTDDGAVCERNESYRPTIYVAGDDDHFPADVRPFVDGLLDVVATDFEEWRTGFRHDPEAVLRVEVDDVDAVRSVARHIRGHGSPGAYKCFNVDLTREFRYCLEEDTQPVPGGSLSTLSLSVPEPELADPPPSKLRIDDAVIEAGPERLLEILEERLATIDPDVLVLDPAEVVPALHTTAGERDYDLQLGRRPGWERLAARSTYESYGRIGHSPARYNVPGRAIIDAANTFFYRETNLEGCLDLVERSGKPLQELSWASIGNVLTAIQIREALDRNVLVPWTSWRHEFFKPMRTLHEADRGGYIFAPDVGFHEDVHELDFASLYPNIICTRNVSPETVRCDCHGDREDVPGLGYGICDERGYLVDVLRPLIDDRAAIKEAIGRTDDPERAAELEGRSSALKWILVACFGYQGFSNAKFGRIECHEAINAFAREILLDAKELLEDGGWRVVHGIVDSLWVTPREDTRQTSLGELAAAITEQVGIRLEYESAFDWIAFVPTRDSDAGALTKYFGRKAEAEYKYRGIECRQRSTPSFVADVQEDLIATLDEHRSPEAVCDRLQRYIGQLEAGEVDPGELVVERRTSKRAAEYDHYTRTVAALERADGQGLDHHPGQNVAYVVVDDEKQSRERVQLAHESIDDYDASFYVELLLRAAESVCAPLGWRRGAIEAYLDRREAASLRAFRD